MVSAQKLILFISGFLGQSQDWDTVWRNLSVLKEQGWTFQALDLFSPRSEDQLRSADGFQSWTNRMVQELDSLHFDQCVIVGYSLGGRLALSLLEQRSSLFKAGVIVSSHPGLTEDSEKSQRMIQDQQWAHDFLNLEWTELMNRWNNQAVFAKDDKSAVVHRHESGYSRQALAQALLEFSLSKQKNFRDWLESTDTAILWVNGEEDFKFRGQAESLPFNEHRSHLIFKGLGHRILNEDPERLARAIEAFLRD